MGAGECLEVECLFPLQPGEELPGQKVYLYVDL